ncbi:MAG: cell surface protein [Odoribacteraceae bacterium]|jgi:hypothetical protein|nr:cell surface protein [Odoribacteraceae bacterium]
MNTFTRNTRAGSLLLSCLLAIGVASCGKDDLDAAAPRVTFDRPDGIYTVKAGKSITITPVVENDAGAFYTWTTADGQLIGREKTLAHAWEEQGQVYITFRVHTDHGSAEREIRVDVAPLVPPLISLAIPPGGFVVLQGRGLLLAPVIDNDEGVTLEWKIGERAVATTREYTFTSDEPGVFHLSLSTVNEDGSDFLAFDVEVKAPAGMPFSWQFERATYNVSVGRAIRLLPRGITNAFDAEYTWSVDGQEKQRAADPLFLFNATVEGLHTAVVTMKNDYTTASRALTVNVCPPEGTYKRAVTASSRVDCNKVHEFLAAPGQFVNEGYTATTMQQACTHAEGRLSSGAHVSLGGFGGYIILGFDHSIENDGGYNFQVLGNSFTGSSEPGIVYVMQDENGDGLPNDTWYELKGSEHGKPGTLQDYEITYYRPRATGMSVTWSDNLGKSGSVDYLAAYHRQEYYYPAWVADNSYTLRGTRLASRTREVTPGYWSNDDFGWGYADNFSATDRLTDNDNHDAGTNANHFKISDAITFDGKPASLQYIDFIKVQTGVNAKAGWLGENSTEVFGAKDYNLIKNK